MADLTILQGRTKVYMTPPMLNADGTVYNLSNATARFMIKKDGLSDDSAIIDYFLVVSGAGTATSSLGMTIGGTNTNVVPPTVYTGASSGVITITITDEDTQSVTPGKFSYELVVMKGVTVGQVLSGGVTITDTLIDDPETLP